MHSRYNPHNSLAILLVISTFLAGICLAADVEVGGDDISRGVTNDMFDGNPDLLMAKNGDLFHVKDTAGTIFVYRSTDGGTTWGVWGSITGVPLDIMKLEHALLVEGTANRLHVLYTTGPLLQYSTLHAWSDISNGPADWQTSTVFSGGPSSYTYDLELAVDVYGWPTNYFVYVIGLGTNTTTHTSQIVYRRSTDQGNTWGPQVILEDEVLGDGPLFLDPQISWGAGQVHVAWGTEFPGPVRGIHYRQANGWNDALSDFQPVVDLVPAGTREKPRLWDLVAASQSNSVHLLYNMPYNDYQSVLMRSGTGGDTWSRVDTIEFESDLALTGLAMNAASDRLYVSGYEHLDGTVCERTPVVLKSVGTWPVFDDKLYFAQVTEGSLFSRLDVAIDPNDSDRLGFLWSDETCGIQDTSSWFFDATWFDDPGYPITESGFPMALNAAPAGPPTVAQLDGDPFSEITWVDENGQAHLVSHLGTEVGGWPKNMGPPIPGTAVAVGDLNGDGVNAMVVGSTDGSIYARNSITGNHLPGFPLSLGSDPVRVTVAPVASPYAKSIVATSGQTVYVVNYRGVVTDSWDLGHDLPFPPAVGDLDGDDTPDIVVAMATDLVRLQPGNPTPVYHLENINLADVSGPLILVDLDRSGRREIVIPFENARIRTWDADGVYLWQYHRGGPGPAIDSVIAANIMAGFEPDLILTSGYEVFHLNYDGTLYNGFPATSYNSGNLTAPVANTVHWTASNIIAGGLTNQLISWSNWGGKPGGWPKALSAPVRYSPATGDVDNDGINEVVTLTDNELLMVDVGVAPQADRTRRWVQWGSDAGHSFCHAADIDLLVSGVQDTAVQSHFAFAPPNPNPASSHSMFSFALPDGGAAEISIMDVRGRRVRTMSAHGLLPGTHRMQFDGRDNQGGRLPDGVYFAQLRASGGGRVFEETRKLTLVR